MTHSDSELNDLFVSYRDACPEVEPSANFMPTLWQKIEARHNFWFVFQRLGRTAMTASAAVCLLLLVLNLISTSQFIPPTYADALMNDHTAEKVYYTEGILTTPPGSDATPVSH